MRSIVACNKSLSVDDRFCDIQGVPKRYFCTFGEKAHTSKRVSIIAPDNAISKAQCATLLRYYANVVCYATPHLHQTIIIRTRFYRVLFLFQGLCTAMPCRLRREPLRADRKRREKQALAFAEIERSGHSQRLYDLSHECAALLLATNR